MNYFRFDLKSAFLFISNACVVVWASVTIEDFYPLLIAVIIASFTCAIYGVSGARSTVVPGGIGGFLAAAAVGLCMCALNGIGYFFYDGPGEYFEDGVFFELVFAPIVYVGVWGMLGAMIGIVCGGLVWITRQTFSRAEKLKTRPK